ncbi:STAS-like domain-containing protein [Methylomonas sp. BW4-1]|uniref:STAS-like domain-containing protein n=1 Tax=Methylomonas sp. BW4-1 TaxID=3376685 RepID=UPI004041A116
MYVVVKHITKLKMPQACHGKQLMSTARECFLKNELLTLDFEGVESVANGFFQEAILPLLTEFGADFLKNKLRLSNITPDLEAFMQNDLNTQAYIDRLSLPRNGNIDPELYELNLAWLIKVRELVRENALQAQLILGIANDDLRNAVAKLSLDDIHSIASAGCLCFAPRFTPEFIEGYAQKRYDLVDVLLALTSEF